MPNEVSPLRLRREKVSPPPPAQAKEKPIASVLVDTGLLHLDDEFDFLVPEEFSSYLLPGSLVSVTFNRRRTLGIVLSRGESSNFNGKLRFISEVINKYPVVSESTLSLVAEIKKYYGGTRWDALRFAIPNQTKKNDDDFAPLEHSIMESKVVNHTFQRDPRYPENFWKALMNNPKSSPQVRAYWSPPPSEDPFIFLKRLIEATPGQVILLMPDRADIDRMVLILEENGDIQGSSIAIWHSELSRKERARTFLDLFSGRKRVIIGVRGAILLPTTNLDLIIVWDEGSETYSEQRAPYFHAREVAIMRSHIDKTHLLLAGFSPTMIATQYITSKYLAHLTPSVDSVKHQMPKIHGITNRTAPEQRGRIPSIAWQTMQRGLKFGPVIIQVPLKGYVLHLTCSRCLNNALCSCGGKLVLTGSQVVPLCYLCGNFVHQWLCSYCSNRQFRNSVIGDSRIAEELGRAFANQRIISSNAEHRIFKVKNEPAIVIATPGAEPIADAGYAAALIFNGNLILQRAGLNAEEEARRRWFGIATLLRPNGEFFLDVDHGNRNIQALIRWDALGASERELLERQALNLPPVVKSVEISGDYQAVSEVVRNLAEPVLVSSPKKMESGETQAILRIPTKQANLVLNEIFRRVRAQSSKGVRVARVKVDPIAI
jgi:primosomal protein N' (replication factor Y)